MTAIAPDSDKLRELDDDTRRAWNAYNEQLRELSGDEYEHAEGSRGQAPEPAPSPNFRMTPYPELELTAPREVTPRAFAPSVG